MAIDDEVAVRRLLVLADAGLEQRSVTQGRKAEARIFANVFQRLRADHALAMGGIEVWATRVVGNLESAAAAARDPIAKPSAMIRPHWHVHVAEARIAGGRPEKEDILLGRPHQRTYGLREQFPQPRAAGENVGVRSDIGTVVKCDPRWRTLVQSVAQDLGLSIPASGRDERVDHRPTTRPCLEISAFRFEDAPFDAFEVDLRPALPHLRRRQLLVLDLRRTQHFHRTALKTVIGARRHPEHATAMQKPAPPLALILRPELKRAGCQVAIRLIGTVCSAHHARFAPRRGPGMPRAPGVKQGDAGALFQQAQSGPSAKDSGADHGDMWLGFHAQKQGSALPGVKASGQVSKSFTRATFPGQVPGLCGRRRFSSAKTWDPATHGRETPQDLETRTLNPGSPS